MFELPQELLNWTRSGLGVFVLACIYLISIAVIVLVALCVLMRLYFRFRHPQEVICPETGTAADIRISAGHAALAQLFGERELCVKTCSRGAGAATHCDHACLSQI